MGAEFKDPDQCHTSLTQINSLALMLIMVCCTSWLEVIQPTTTTKAALLYLDGLRLVGTAVEKASPCRAWKCLSLDLYRHILHRTGTVVLSASPASCSCSSNGLAQETSMISVIKSLKLLLNT
jgi:hypothetical protein